MAHCYQCGRHLEPERPFQRRRVKTAEYLARHYPQQSIKGWRINYGQRIVCTWCARRIDRELRRAEILDWVKIIGGLVLLGMLVSMTR